MPNIEVKLRKGSATDHTSFAGALGEVTVDTTNQTLHVHNGSGTAGSGVALRRKDDTIAGSEIDNDAVGTAQIAANAVTSTEISSTDSTFSIDGDGNMGLGIAANSAAKLYIAGTGGNTFLAVKSDTMAAIDLEDNGASTNQKHYQMVSLDGDFEIRQLNDDLTLKYTPFSVNSSGQVRLGGSLSNIILESISQFGITSGTDQTALTVESTAASQNATAVLTAPGNATLQLKDTSELATDTGTYNLSSIGGEFQIGSIEEGGGGPNLTCMSLIRKTLSAHDYIVPQIPNLPTFANNSAATSGGLSTNDVYKTSTGELRIVV